MMAGGKGMIGCAMNGIGWELRGNPSRYGGGEVRGSSHSSVGGSRYRYGVSNDRLYWGKMEAGRRGQAAIWKGVYSRVPMSKFRRRWSVSWDGGE